MPKLVKVKKDAAVTTPPTRKDLERADKVMRKLTGGEEAPGKRILPLVTSLFNSDSDVYEAVEWLEKGWRLKKEIEAATTEYEEVKEQLTAISVGAGVAGYRYGSLSVSVGKVEGRKVLDKEALRAGMVDAGIAPAMVAEIIEKAHRRGDGFYVVKIDGRG